MAAALPTTAQLRDAGVAFEALFLRLIDEHSWMGRRRAGGQRAKDALRRKLGLQGAGATLAAVALTPGKADMLAVFFRELQAWGDALSSPAALSLVQAAVTDAHEDGEADAALVSALGDLHDPSRIRQAIRARAEAQATGARVMAALQRQLDDVLAERQAYRIVRPSRAVAARSVR